MSSCLGQRNGAIDASSPKKMFNRASTHNGVGDLFVNLISRIKIYSPSFGGGSSIFVEQISGNVAIATFRSGISDLA